MNKDALKKWIARILIYGTPFILGLGGFYLEKYNPTFSLTEQFGSWLSNRVGALDIGFFSAVGDFFYNLYATAVLFFVNPLDIAPNALVLIAELWAMVITTSFILDKLTNIKALFARFFCNFDKKKSTAIYCDEKSLYGEMLLEHSKKSYLCADEKSWKPQGSKNHIIMFEDDMKNLRFYMSNRDKFKGKKVYLLLDQFDPYLLNSDSASEGFYVDQESDYDSEVKRYHTEYQKYAKKKAAHADVHYFNFYELMARDYWKKHNLYDRIFEKKHMKIAIIGYGNVGKAIFRIGYLNNLYGINQCVEYHLWGVDSAEKAFLEKLDTKKEEAGMDKIVLHDVDFYESLAELKEMHRIILTESVSLDQLQFLLQNNAEAEIYQYCNDDIIGKEFLAASNVSFFGSMKDIVTDSVIKDEKTYLLAKWFNYDYIIGTFLNLKLANKAKAPDESSDESTNKDSTEVKKMSNVDFCAKYNNDTETFLKEHVKYIEWEWASLTGFFKGSNIARADHYWIEKRLSADGISDEELEELEHMRWCRYYYVNHWDYGEIKDKDTNKDKKKKKHSLLVPFEMLPEKEKKKDGFQCSLTEQLINANVDAEM